MFGFSAQSLPAVFLVIEELSQILSQMYIRLYVKYPLFLSDFNHIFSTYFLKIIKYESYWKSVHLEPSCSSLTNRQDESNSRFSQLCTRALFHRSSNILRVVSGFGRKAYEKRALLGYCTAGSGNFLQTFRDNQSVPSSKYYCFIFHIHKIM